MNELSMESYYVYCLPYDFYFDSTHIIIVQINHDQLEPGSGMLENMVSMYHGRLHSSFIDLSSTPI